MSFVVTFTCMNGHVQRLTYGRGFDRASVESHAAILAGGYLDHLGITMPGIGCTRCGDPIKHTVDEVPDGPPAD